MQMPARFPSLRNGTRSPDSGTQGIQLGNRVFSIGPLKLEFERADNPGPRSLEVQARPIAHNGLRGAFRPGPHVNWRERRPSLRNVPRGEGAPTVLPQETGLPNRIDPSTVDFREALRRSSGDRKVRLAGPWPLNGQNCTVLLTDVVGFSSPVRSYEDRRAIRDALCDMTGTMLQGIADAWSEGRGDGILTVLWPSIPTRTVVCRLREVLLPALMRHNSAQYGPARFQLRAALGVGPLFSDTMGPSGDEINTIARLVQALPFKKAMETSGASLGIVTTRFIYETVIEHDRNLCGYQPIQVEVKTYKGPAWMNVIDTPVPVHGDIDPALAC
jgi:hypothetical protein